MIFRDCLCDEDPRSKEQPMVNPSALFDEGPAYVSTCDDVKVGVSPQLFTLVRMQPNIGDPKVKLFHPLKDHGQALGYVRHAFLPTPKAVVWETEI